MNFEDFISSTDANPRPRKLVIYGGEGLGKTTFAARCPFGPVVFLCTEDGAQDVRPAVKQITFGGKRIIDSESELLEAISLLVNNDHGFGCVVLDSAEAAEAMIQKTVAATANKESLAEIGFGKGHAAAANKFTQLLAGFDALVAKGMFVIIIAHSTIEKAQNPSGDAYDYYTPRLDKRTSPILREWADEIFYLSPKVYTTTVDEGFGKKTAKAHGVGERVIYTTERPTYAAKNRLNLPDEIPFPKDASVPWGIYSAAISNGSTL